MFCLKLLISFSLLVNHRVKLTGMSREECVGSTIPALKLGRSPAPSSRPFRLSCVPSARDQNLCRHICLYPDICICVHGYFDRSLTTLVVVLHHLTLVVWISLTAHSDHPASSAQGREKDHLLRTAEFHYAGADLDFFSLSSTTTLRTYLTTSSR